MIDSFNVQDTNKTLGTIPTNKQVNLQRLAYHGSIHENDSTFSDTFKMFRDVLAEKPEPSINNPAIAEQWNLDGSRNQLFSLKIAQPDGTIRISQNPLDGLQNLVNLLSANDSQTLMLKLSSLCSQLYFNPLAGLLHDTTREEMADYGFCTIPSAHEEQCVLVHGENSIEAHMVLHSDKITIFPLQGEDPFEIQCPVTAKAVISIPVNDPEHYSLSKLQLNINEPIQRSIDH